MTSPSQAIPPETFFIGDLQSYDDCGIVNGITADSFIVPWVFFFFTAFFDGKNMGFTMGKW
jgi:hypothetical protein